MRSRTVALTVVLMGSVLGWACGPVGGAVYRHAKSSSGSAGSSSDPIKGVSTHRQTNRATRAVVVNDVRLGDDELAALESEFQLRIADGEYWYDSVSGAWGMQGGPTKGFVPAGLGFGGELSPDASRGATGVYVNGRELHLLDVIALQRFTQVPQGRYWLDAQGNGGLEGEGASFNLYALAASAGGNGPGPWSYYTQAPLGASTGGDGQGFSYYIDRDTSWTSP